MYAVAEKRDTDTMPLMTEQTPADRRRHALRQFMERRGLTMNGWASEAGASESALRGFLSGRTESLNIDTYEKLASAAGVPIEALLPPRNPDTLPLPSEADPESYDEAVRRVRQVFSALGKGNRDEEAKAIAHVYHQLMQAKDRH